MLTGHLRVADASGDLLFNLGDVEHQSDYFKPVPNVDHAFDLAGHQGELDGAFAGELLRDRAGVHRVIGLDLLSGSIVSVGPIELEDRMGWNFPVARADGDVLSHVGEGGAPADEDIAGDLLGLGCHCAFAVMDVLHG